MTTHLLIQKKIRIIETGSPRGIRTWMMRRCLDGVSQWGWWVYCLSNVRNIKRNLKITEIDIKLGKYGSHTRNPCHWRSARTWVSWARSDAPSKSRFPPNHDESILHPSPRRQEILFKPDRRGIRCVEFEFESGIEDRSLWVATSAFAEGGFNAFVSDINYNISTMGFEIRTIKDFVSRCIQIFAWKAIGRFSNL